MSEGNGKYQERTYSADEACVFRKTKEAFGGLSNMASGFPLIVNGIRFFSSEALYQACRFPHLPDVQSKIISERSPMSAKMVGKPFRNDSRLDWEAVRIEIMTWCLRVKLAQNFISFGQLLESTHDKPIVEDSSKDPFWGAMRDKENPKQLTGVNALGRLLMKLRQDYNSPNRFSLLYVEPLSIPNFHLYGRPICEVDEREKFLNYLHQLWGKPVPKNQYRLIVHAPLTVHKLYPAGSFQQTTVISEPEPKKQAKAKTKKVAQAKKASTPKKQAKREPEAQQELPML